MGCPPNIVIFGGQPEKTRRNYGKGNNLFLHNTVSTRQVKRSFQVCVERKFFPCDKWYNF